MTTAAFEPVDIEMMQQAIGEARAALEHDDVPVGAVVVRSGQIIAARHNERELSGDPTAHAELLALRDAAREVGHWRLNECSLFVTLEPCSMCAGACVNARLGRLIYATPDPKAGACLSNFGIHDGQILNHRVPTTTGPCADEAAELLRAFFRARR